MRNAVKVLGLVALFATVGFAFSSCEGMDGFFDMECDCEFTIGCDCHGGMGCTCELGIGCACDFGDGDLGDDPWFYATGS